jgi:hypothetical protein
MNNRIGFWLLFALVLPCLSLAADKPAQKKKQSKAPAKVSLLYVQTAGSGTFEPIAGSSSKFRLVLNDVSPNVVYFSDRPNRLAGQVSTTHFLKRIGFGGDLNPNAAIDIQGAPSDSDVIVAALSRPAYDRRSKTLSYEITVLDTAREGLASFSKEMDERLPARFGSVAIFIDDAPCGDCTGNGRCCPGFFCYDPGTAASPTTPRCMPCHPGQIYDECGGVND